MDKIFMVLDNDVLDKYNKYYFEKYPKRHKVPIARPMHPSINVWMIMQRQAMNGLKQAWKDFIKWWVKDLGYQDKHLGKFEMTFTTYMPTRRRADPDNFSPKFIEDGFTEAGLIADDDGTHLKALTLKTDYDKENPRTEIEIKILDE